LKLLENKKHYKKKIMMNSTTEEPTYKEMIRNKAKQTRITPELLKYHRIDSRISDDGMVYKCMCCDDKDEDWKSEWCIKSHIHSIKHTKNYRSCKTIEKLEEKYEKAQEKIRELEKELFEFKGVNRIKSFLEECEECDYIMKCEDDEVQMPNGKTIVREISYSVAPTPFDEIFYDFCKWSEDIFTGDLCKDNVKKFLLEYQKNSSYGLDIGEYEEELKKNGTYENPVFNFRFPFNI
jgi:hypothetical protein